MKNETSSENVVFNLSSGVEDPHILLQKPLTISPDISCMLTFKLNKYGRNKHKIIK
jgi:hypothetical protein